MIERSKSPSPVFFFLISQYFNYPTSQYVNNLFRWYSIEVCVAYVPIAFGIISQAKSTIPLHKVGVNVSDGYLRGPKSTSDLMKPKDDRTILIGNARGSQEFLGDSAVDRSIPIGALVFVFCFAIIMCIVVWFILLNSSDLQAAGAAKAVAKAKRRQQRWWRPRQRPPCCGRRCAYCSWARRRSWGRWSLVCRGRDMPTRLHLAMQKPFVWLPEYLRHGWVEHSILVALILVLHHCSLIACNSRARGSSVQPGSSDAAFFLVSGKPGRVGNLHAGACFLGSKFYSCDIKDTK